MRDDTGFRGERAAERSYLSLGYKLLERNYRTRLGEIDLIMHDRQFIVFVEVKTRSSGALVGGLESVTSKKQSKLRATALLYLESHPSPLQPRFDVVEVARGEDGSMIIAKMVENAF